jgi:predicted O-methyltransferase YrrM
VGKAWRTKDFASRDHDRYWWFKAFSPQYDPPIFDMLDDAEWAIMSDWYEETEVRFGATGTGECAIPAMSMLQSFIMGNNLSRVVQLGHFIGFSSLLLGFAFKRMGLSQSLYSIDIDFDVTAYTKSWLARAKLEDQVQLEVADSSSPEAADNAIKYLGGAPQLIFVDSSHAYQHTIDELNVWYPRLQPGGFIFLHDVSQFAASFDYTDQGGVAAAVAGWLARSDASGLLLNGGLLTEHGDAVVYRDGCGLGMIQKPFNPRQQASA